ncbi:MAG: phosphodiester glycosidase family protein [Oscillospiraceae bacterium]
MKKLLSLILAATLLITPAFAAGSGTGQAVYSNKTALADGLTYENTISATSGGRLVETFTLETAAKSSVHPIVLACDTIYGGMNVNSMIKYAKGLGYNVVGAVNADFGYWDTRVPCGMVVENGIYKSSPEGNNALAFTADGAFASFMPEVNITLTNTVSGGAVPLTHFNKTRADKGGLYLFSEHFSTVSTRTTGNGWFVRFKILDGKMTLGGSMSLEVAEIITDKPAVSIGEGYLVLSAAEAAELGAVRDSFKIGDRVTLTTSCTDSKLAAATWVSGCGNILLSEGKVYHSEWWDKDISAVNPRTAVGIKADGSIVYHVMDGRRTASKGATLAELAQDMISMGCVSAVNMDGGGSSVMSLLTPGADSCRVLNSPSDGTLRSVCSYILFVTDEKPSGAAENLFLKEDGAFALAGTTLDLHYLSTDNTMKTIATPTDVTAYSSLGPVVAGKYTAPGAAGEDVVKLSAAGASGSGRIHVITKADSIAVKNLATDKAVTSLVMNQKDELKLAASVKYLFRDVYMDKASVKYSVAGDVGTVTPEGVFTASGKPGAEGKITVAAAGLTYDITVKLAFEFSDMQKHWAGEYVKKLYEAGIVSGTSATEYTPDAGMKRCDFTLMLYKAAGSPTTDAVKSSFTDVPADAYYAKAVAWAEANGIAKGDGTGKFDPAGILTREQGFTFTYRALPLLKVEYTEGDVAGLTAFSDGAALKDWSRQATATLVSMGIVGGSDGKLDPSASLTRAAMAKILCVTLYRA